MKYLITTLAIVILFIGSVQAQPQSLAQRSFRLSFSVNPSVNWMASGETEIKRENTTEGVDFGINADFFIDPAQRYAFTTGVLISSLGGEMTYNTNDDFSFSSSTFQSGTTLRYRLKYIEIPTVIKLRTTQFDRWTYWTQFGVSSFVNIGAKADSNDGQLDKSDIDDQINLFNMALNIGIGGEYDLGAGNGLSVGIVYNGGFMDITKDKNGFDEKMTLNSLKLKLALLF